MSRCVMPILCAKSSARVHLKTISTDLVDRQQVLRRAEPLQRAAVHVLHHDVVRRFVGDRVVDLADVRVLQLAGERGLGDEKLAVELAALRVVEQRRGNQLDRDVALGEGVVAEVDLGRGAGAQVAHDRVLADLLRLVQRRVHCRCLSVARLRALATAARTCAGAVPPRWLRAATEPSSVSDLVDVLADLLREALQRRQAATRRGRSPPFPRRAPRARRLRARRGTAGPCAPGSRRGRWRWRGLRSAAARIAFACGCRPATSAREGLQRVLHRVDGVEQRLLVFLVVLVVRERLALHQRQQRHQVADHAPALAAHQFRHVRVLLLRHDRAAGAEAVRDAHEAEARAHPEDQFLGEARQVHHDERGAGGELDREVAVGDRVQRVRRDVLEAQLARDPLAVDREGGAGERRRAQRQHVHAPAAVGEPRAVALEHRRVGEQVVAEGDRLRDLQVREAGHHQRRRGAPPARAAPARARRRLRVDLVDLVAQPQAHVGGDLVVARARRVQPLAGVARELDQAALDVAVHVLVRRPTRRTCRRGSPRGPSPAPPSIAFRSARADHAAGREHARVRERARDIVHGEPLVEGDRGGETLHERVHRLREAARPRLAFLPLPGCRCGHGD